MQTHWGLSVTATKDENFQAQTLLVMITCYFNNTINLKRCKKVIQSAGDFDESKMSGKHTVRCFKVLKGLITCRAGKK